MAEYDAYRRVMTDCNIEVAGVFILWAGVTLNASRGVY